LTVATAWLQVLGSELPGLVSSLSFKKSMRWDGFGVAYSRPMRWLLALHGDTPIPFSYGGIVAGPSTRVLRNAPQPQLQVPSAGSYLDVLQKEAIQLDFAARRKAIWEGASAAAAEVSSDRLRTGWMVLTHGRW
jgi:glycyl-tRNA synthetase